MRGRSPAARLPSSCAEVSKRIVDPQVELAALREAFDLVSVGMIALSPDGVFRVGPSIAGRHGRCPSRRLKTYGQAVAPAGSAGIRRHCKARAEDVWEGPIHRIGHDVEGLRRT